VHFGEIQRFVDASARVDPNADTIPAPPPVDDGTVDPDQVPTQRCPRVVPPDSTLLPPEALDLRDRSEAFWGGVAGLVESR
jgi:hypothetical protein